MALKKSQLYSSLWASCDELRGSMDASQYKDYVLSLLFIKYISDKYADIPFPSITVPVGAGFKDMIALKGTSDIGDQINKKIITPLADANQTLSPADFPDFNDSVKLGDGKEKVDRLTNLIAIFEDLSLDFSKHHAGGDDIMGDAYEYLMRHFATESGKSKGQFYTPAEVSRIMAQVIGIKAAETSTNTTVYDPTCGSGSLLLKVLDEAGSRVTLYGQEKDAATSGLARMNMILHNTPTALIRQGNTFTDPKFKDGDTLKMFDYVVANPPFSDKRWRTGLDPLNDPHNRFKTFGVPPDKQGDYAYLLHIIRSLKSTGAGACILPHGVLFRGNAEADIRHNLVRWGYIKGIIGLPPNLFYGTGIPACIVIVEKKNAQASKGIFMIDASQGFMKEGPKNRLRSQDIHKIVDSFTKKAEIPDYSRMVPFSEIESNGYNLNLPRYIKNRKQEDCQDINGHLLGGIPEADINHLQEYWDVCPRLKIALFAKCRAGYINLAIDKTTIKPTISKHSEFVGFIEEMEKHFDEWRHRSAIKLKTLEVGNNPREIIFNLSEDLLAHYTGKPLINRYKVYQRIMDYWTEQMQDDCYQIAVEGWTARIEFFEENKRWLCDLIPKELIVARYFAAEQTKIDHLSATLEELEAQLVELKEEYGSNEGVLANVNSKSGARVAWSDALDEAWAELMPETYEVYHGTLAELEELEVSQTELIKRPEFANLVNCHGTVTLKNVRARLKATIGSNERNLLESFIHGRAKIHNAKKMVKEFLDQSTKTILVKLEAGLEKETLDDLHTLSTYRKIIDRISDVKTKIKEAEKMLDHVARDKYSELSIDEIKNLVVDDKWLGRMANDIHDEMNQISQILTQRIQILADRYEASMPKLTDKVVDCEVKVRKHLKKMGFAW